jgi:hypothetical protein
LAILWVKGNQMKCVSAKKRHAETLG